MIDAHTPAAGGSPHCRMTRRAWLAALAILAVATIVRLYALELRPPHHDEGVNGWFVEHMHTEGYYRYDPTNYHGPTYFYLLWAAREVLGFGLWQLRLPGALIGALLCAAPLVLRRHLGSTRTLAACALLATSPSLVYYARYAIHETLLAAFGLVVAVAALRWSDSGRLRWLLVTAAALAAMIATKETTALFVAVAALWLGGEIAVESWRARALVMLGRRVRWSRRLVIGAAGIAAVMAVVHVVLFTGLFETPGSLAEQLARSLDAYRLWAHAGTADGGHAKPWCYYLHLGARYELALYLLAAVGTVAGFRERWIRGPGLVGFGLAVAYSLVAYKMPWLPLGWLALFAIPAAHGTLVAGRVLGAELSGRLGPGAALVAAAAAALAITARSSFVRPASPREDLAYVHTSPEYHEWFGIIARAGDVLGPANLRVAVTHGATWPLAWSLMPYPGTRWTASGDEDVIIAPVEQAAELERRLRGGYLRREYQIRDSAGAAYVYVRGALYAHERVRGNLPPGARFTPVGGSGPVAGGR
jgi:uncharacterized protein (TIGR03663 family)